MKDCRLDDKIRAVVKDLAREHQRELAEAGRLVDFEELTYQIGDEIARQLCQHVLLGRAERALKGEFGDCPECGEPGMVCEPEPTVLAGLRGELAYRQPHYYCPRCRRSFFPMAASLGVSARSHVTPIVLRKMVWAGSSLGSFAVAEEALDELAGLSISSRRIRCAVERIGTERVSKRIEAVERFLRCPIDGGHGPFGLEGSLVATGVEVGLIAGLAATVWRRGVKAARYENAAVTSFTSTETTILPGEAVVPAETVVVRLADEDDHAFDGNETTRDNHTADDSPATGLEDQATDLTK